MTSNVALEACSAERRTSIGPETEASAFVLPEDQQEEVSINTKSICLRCSLAGLLPKQNRAEPSTPCSPSYVDSVILYSVGCLPSRLVKLITQG